MIFELMDRLPCVPARIPGDWAERSELGVGNAFGNVGQWTIEETTKLVEQQIPSQVEIIPLHVKIR